jgi:outer membrane lipoprotein SlyB
MNTSNTPSVRSRHHPLLLVAAVAVILFCAVGTAAIMGWLPSSKGGSRGQLTDADRAALSAGLQQPGAAAPQYPAEALAQAPATAAAPLAPLVPPSGAQAYAAVPDAAYGASGSRGATAAGTEPQYAPAQPAPRAEPAPERVVEADTGSGWCANCGNVESIREIRTRAQGSGVGAAGGAILGGLLGNQIGSGHGRQLATVAGAVGGAVMGNQVEGNMKANTSYEIRVRLDDGKLRTFHQHSVPQWRSGDRVRIVKGALRSA